MNELNPSKLHVAIQNGTPGQELCLPRRYTLTHSDITGDLFLSIGADYNRRQISGLYTRLMRDEVLAELRDDGDGPRLHVYCHVSGGLSFGTAAWRNAILHHHMRMVLEALRYGDRGLISAHPELDETTVKVHFASNRVRYNRVEIWGPLKGYL